MSSAYHVLYGQTDRQTERQTDRQLCTVCRNYGWDSDVRKLLLQLLRNEWTLSTVLRQHGDLLWLDTITSHQRPHDIRLYTQQQHSHTVPLWLDTITSHQWPHDIRLYTTTAQSYCPAVTRHHNVSPATSRHTTVYNNSTVIQSRCDSTP